MTKEFEYQDKADPKDFAPDFAEKKEPYGEPVSEILELLHSNLKPESEILDIAGGYGRYAIPLIRAGHRVTIIDIHEASLIEARERASLVAGGEGLLSVSNADILRDSTAAGTAKYDAAICIGFLHHLNAEGGRRVFSSMVHAVRPGGFITIEYSCDKDRRMPSGDKILVDGDTEHNVTVEQGRLYLEQLASMNDLVDIDMPLKQLQIRDDDFWYDANMIIFHARKK